MNSNSNFQSEPSNINEQDYNTDENKKGDKANKGDTNKGDTNKGDTNIIPIINIIDGVYLLILTVMGNFVAELLGCKSQKLLNNNMYAKHLLTIIVIYFAIGFSGNDSSVSPGTRVKYAFVIWLLFVLFTKMNIYVTGFSFIILTSIYIITDYVKYYQTIDKNNKDETNKELISRLNNYSDIMIKILIGTILGGSSIYAYKQYIDHKSNFSLMKLIFGTLKCDSLN